MDFFFASVTWIGSLYVLSPLAMLLCILLLWHGKSGQAIFIASSLLATVVSVHAAKLLIRRPRPPATDVLVVMPSDWSFPSAHTAQAASFFLSCAVVMFQLFPPPWATFFSILNLLLIFCVGYSRVYLQVHYVSDVLAGFFLATILVAALHYILSSRH